MNRSLFISFALFAVVMSSCSNDDEIGNYFQPQDLIDVKACCERVEMKVLSPSSPERIDFQLVCIHDEEASAARENNNQRIEKEILNFITTQQFTYGNMPPFQVYVLDDSVAEIRITANKTLYGIEAGGSLNKHFGVTTSWYNTLVPYPTTDIKKLRQLKNSSYSSVESVLKPEYMLLYAMNFAAYQIPEYYYYDDVDITVYLRLTSGAEFTVSQTIPFYN